MGMLKGYFQQFTKQNGRQGLNGCQFDLQLKQDVMGADCQSSIKYDLTLYSQSELHAVQGPVPIYRLKGEPLYIFSTSSNSSLFVKLAEKIQNQKHPHLTHYYGNLYLNQRVSTNRQYFCSSDEQKLMAFWTYHNTVLSDRVRSNVFQRTEPSQDELWGMMAIMCQTASILMSYGLFLDFDFRNIQLSVIKRVQVYWGNAKIGNAHRPFYRALTQTKQLPLESYSPEQLKALSKKLVTIKFDLQKCVVHSIGRLLVLYANNLNDFAEIIDYKNLQIKSSVINKLLNKISQKHSNSLYVALKGMLQEDVSKRMNFSALLNVINEEGRIEKHRSKDYQMTQFRQKNSPSNTCTSSKVSVRITTAF